MLCFDILFPINLGPLTYSCPEQLAETMQPGMVIQAPLKSKMTRGIILSKNSSPPQGQLKKVQLIPGESALLSMSLLKLIKWMSDYYIAPEGLVLKQTLPKEFFVKTKPRKGKKGANPAAAINFYDIRPEEIRDIEANHLSGKYQGFLLHAPSLLYEYSIAFTLLGTFKNIIVILPDTSQADLLYASFKEQYADRLCLLHGDISAGRRSEGIEGILSGRHDIVIGTRSALFAPLKKVSLIIVLNEHSPSYKVEEGVRYNMRDVAVMRGFMEKASVILSSISPSIDSYFNALMKKYLLIKPAPYDRRPDVRIADMRSEKKVRADFSKTVYEAAKKHIKRNNKVLFVINRRGYSSLLICHECSYIVKCVQCDVPMVFHKNDNTLRCHYCKKIEPVTERCPRCNSHNFELLGSGTQRVQEDVEELFEKATMMFDSDNVRKKSEKEEIAKLISGDFSRILIGTKVMTSRIAVTNKYSMAAVMNIDCTLNLPDFRATERAYQELSYIIDLVEPGGEVFIQTRFPQVPIFKNLRSNNYASFATGELSLRRSLNYPPYSKLLHITFSGPADLPEKMERIIHTVDPHIEILGHAIRKNSAGVRNCSIILKSADRKALNKAARTVLQTFVSYRNVKIRTDVDPI